MNSELVIPMSTNKTILYTALTRRLSANFTKQAHFSQNKKYYAGVLV